MDKTYSPKDIEQKHYNNWEEQGFFKPCGAENSNGENFSIAIPPPNVTGSLHMGHAFQDTIMDCLIRYNRMLGKNTLWQPGTDHAGIATQMVVERKLAKEENKTKHDLGRDKFIEKIWEWKEESGGNISSQLRRLGASADWSRERFTMDEGLSNAVQEVFVNLFDEGLIYRGKRLVNWDPVLKTAISDLEVINEEESGHMYHVRYPFVKGQGVDGKFMHIATTRPETILADGALAVHPSDERYIDLIGKMVHVPMTERTIAIITDEYPDPEFGTGCVKITPAHDFNDYEVEQRHEMEIINLLNDDATMNDNAPEKYRGLDRFDARKAIVADLKEAELLEKIEPHKLMRPRGDRTNSVVEPYLTDQWYVKTAPLAKDAIAAVEKGNIKFVPKQYENMYFSWMRDLQDWCISRQLWWGHRIPAWYDENGNIFVGRNEIEIRKKYNLADNISLRQDEDVLDTWFSSGLWTFSTLGWPENTEDLKQFHPTSTLVTGFDIIFFWVARMIMMTMHQLKDDNQKPVIPFETVYVTGLIRDENGQKMSKSKGNVLDPIDMIDGIGLEELVTKRTSNMMNPQEAEKIEKATRKNFPNGIEQHGTDALRFTLAALASTGRDINWDMKRLEGYRNFCNKIWNAARFVLMKTEDFSINNEIEYSTFDNWIKAEFNKTAKNVNKAIIDYRFDFAAKELYEFIWNTYCDWYLELTKPILFSDNKALIAGTQKTLLEVLEASLRLAHPIMPFITEEIWQTIKTKLDITGESIMVASFPKENEFEFEAKSSENVEWIKQVLIGIRTIKSEMDIAPSKQIPILIENTSEFDKQNLEIYKEILPKLGKLESIELIDKNNTETAVTLVGNMKIHIPLAGLIDKDAELERLNREITKLQTSVDRLNGQLNNEKYVANAPEQLVAKSKSQRDEQQLAIDNLLEQKTKIEMM